MKQTLTETEYRKIHRWLWKNFGRPNHCDNPDCDSSGGIYETFDWALIHGKNYDYDITHFRQLCRRCHKKYDMNIDVEDKIEIIHSYNPKTIIKLISRYEQKLKERGSYMNPKVKMRLIEKIEKLKSEL